MADRSGPTVSFIIATRNRATPLKAAIEAARGQTVRDIEIVVVDDGSTDDTASVCAAAQRGDERIRAFRCPGVGRSAARNTGLTNARGKWVVFLDDDDLVADTFAARMLEAASGAYACCCEAVAFDAALEQEVSASRILHGPAGSAGTRGLIAVPLPDTINLADLILANLFPINAVLVERRTLLRLGGFRPGLDFAEDYELWLRLISAVGPIPVLHERLALVRSHEQRSSRDLGRMAESAISVIRECLERESGTGRLPPRGLVRRRIARLAREQAYAALLEGDSRSARNAAMESVRTWPWSLKGWLYLGLAPTPRSYLGLRAVFLSTLPRRARGAHRC
ncbi:MAG: glycosyltransferase family 2 protein [Acidobacteriota bacterium]